FRLFLQRLPARGFAVVCTDAIAGRGLAQTMRGAGGARALTYGLEPSADYSARILEMAGSRTVFEARRGDHALGRVILAVPGAYNAQNALGALAASLELGVPFASAAAALETFRGVQRRFT